MVEQFSRATLEKTAEFVHSIMPPTPQYAWPLLHKQLGVETWVKHENHTPTGAFKVRGGLVYMNELKQREPDVNGVISATRGNHGQSIALSASRLGLRSVIYAPHGNSSEKNAAMRAFGAELVTHGKDFDEAKDACAAAAEAEGLHFVPSFHEDLVRGVSTYAFEFFSAVPDLDVVYAPIGMGSGICGIVGARDALGLKTEIVGVVAENAPTIALSFERRRLVPTNSADTFADGMACRDPNPDALSIIWDGVERIVTLSENDIADAIRLYYTATHNVAEGAGAAPLAAIAKEGNRLKGKRVGAILSGGNIDSALFVAVMNNGQMTKIQQ
ncbi:MAG: threonine dehydratase [Pseudomonadota bacterium]